MWWCTQFTMTGCNHAREANAHAPCHLTSATSQVNEHELHWLPVKCRIEYKIATSAFNHSSSLPVFLSLSHHLPTLPFSQAWQRKAPFCSQNKHQILWPASLRVPSPDCFEFDPNSHSQLWHSVPSSSKGNSKLTRPRKSVCISNECCFPLCKYSSTNV